MTAAEVYESVTNGGVTDFAAVIDVLRNHEPWCLIGGLAINCYVEPIYTIDADIVVVSRQLAAIAEELAAAGFTVRMFEHSLNAQRGKGKLNIQFTTDPRYQDFIHDAAPAEVLGHRVPVATLAHLVRGKLWAWQDKERRVSKRKKDELDLLRVAEAYPELRASMPTEILSQLDE